MAKKIEKTPTGHIAYISKGKEGFIVSAATGKIKPVTPTTTTITPAGSKIIIPWGDDNLFPNNVIKEIRKNSVIAPKLDEIARRAYAGGIVYGMVSYDDDGNELFKPRRILEIEMWKRRWNEMYYLMEASKDLYYTYNVFPEIIISRDRSMITGMSIQAAEECRWGRPDTDGLVKYCYINGEWDTGKGKPENSAKVPVLDPYWDPVESLRERSDSFKYIYPISYPTPGCKYYQLADWDVIRTSGWLDVANAIPKFKKALMKNQMTIKYHIQIPEEYFDFKYQGFSSLSDTDKDEIFKKELDNFNTFLTNTDNTGKTLMTLKKTDGAGKEFASWEIKSIDDKIKDGIYIEDSREANSHIYAALGEHAALTGSNSSGGNRAGSGSDIRVALNKHVSAIQPHQHLLLQVHRLAFDYNGWTDKYSNENEWLELRFRNSLVTKLDEGTETTQEAS